MKRLSLERIHVIPSFPHIIGFSLPVDCSKAYQISVPELATDFLTQGLVIVGDGVEVPRC